jgi:hypothetical protein
VLQVGGKYEHRSVLHSHDDLIGILGRELDHGWLDDPALITRVMKVATASADCCTLFARGRPISNRSTSRPFARRPDRASPPRGCRLSELGTVSVSFPYL